MFNTERIKGLEFDTRQVRRENKTLVEEVRILREDFTALLDTLGLKVKPGRSIIEKTEK